ncbi:MAG TPA: hypothetical protein VIE13_07135 [Terriglobales bacterium]
MSSEVDSPPSPPLAGVPLPLAVPRPAPPRGLWLRLTLFTMLLGAVLTILYAWVLAPPPLPLDGDAAAGGLHGVLIPLMALLAIVGALVLERAAALGVLLMLAGAGVCLSGGAAWLVPGALLGCIWAARRQPAARTTLGLVLLIPGIAFGYYGLMSTVSFSTGLPVFGLPPGLAEPASLAQALAPLELLPIAVLGAWLLVRPLPQDPPSWR